MKIRHKRTGVVLEGEFREFDNAVFIEVGKTSSTYSSSHWEPVQEWVDVTSECKWVKHPYGEYDSRWVNDWYLDHRGARVEGCPGQYRVRQVRVQYTPTSPFEWAFIVEKRVD